MSDHMGIFATTLTLSRGEFGENQKNFSERTGININRIKSWEDARTLPRLQELSSVSLAYEIPYKKLSALWQRANDQRSSTVKTRRSMRRDERRAQDVANLFSGGGASSSPGSRKTPHHQPGFKSE